VKWAARQADACRRGEREYVGIHLGGRLDPAEDGAQALPEPGLRGRGRVGERDAAGLAQDLAALRGQVEQVLGRSGFGLVDVRSPEEYRGEKLAPDHLPQEGAQRPGHIPDARNVPWAKAVDPETGAFLPAEQLRGLYERHGLTPDLEVVAYCRIGERSAHTWFVLHELLGIQAPGVREERLDVGPDAGRETLRYRTTGLRFLVRSGGRMFLLHGLIGCRASGSMPTVR